MKPPELIERLHTLSASSSPIKTVLVAPINPNEASNFVASLNEAIDRRRDKVEGLVTSQDLKELLDWIEDLMHPPSKKDLDLFSEYES